MTVTSGTDKSDLHKQNVRVCFFSEQNTSVATRNKFSESLLSKYAELLHLEFLVASILKKQGHYKLTYFKNQKIGISAPLT
jgi:hypothetical protein